MDWSPEDAMKAYLHTIQLCKIHDCTLGLGTSTRLIEPKYVELISALAAGKGAKLMVEITSNGISPLTLALAVAAKQTGGRLVCIIHDDHDIEKSKARLTENDLEDTIDFVYGNPCEVINRYKSIDFAVIDCKLEDHIKLFKTINLNPSGSIVAVSNLQHRRDGRISFAEVLKGRNIGVKSVTLPIGEGVELTRIGSTGKRETGRSYKRFHVIFEN
ncbi:uncharacterized protein LOC121249670 [Juglans microcarpa x Juglans regia]|uniref:uncharacterized protein LOC121249670 n=1 Tax=Juglans microcarpa x Juglans regia TaxID=2249226 RepID=UPI001B7E6AB5|nr:uncharacterized protein LOC121249670 [Juglans microcarpa x Juglans regia]